MATFTKFSRKLGKRQRKQKRRFSKGLGKSLRKKKANSIVDRITQAYS